ncbi:MAG: LytR/AlgR family response regulator transcription factor [Cellulosilyticaceae bacterium]
MISIALCDDDACYLDATHLLVKQYSHDHPDLAFQIMTFLSPSDLQSFMTINHSFDIYLLDMIMPECNGITLGEHIRLTDPNGIIIYLTSSTEYALASYNVAAFHYLVKPLTQDTLFSVLNQALVKIQQYQKQCLYVKTKDGLTAVPHYDILFIEYISHTIMVHLHSGLFITSVSLRTPFAKIADELVCYPYFVRPHTSFIVNLHHVHTLTAKSFILTNESIIPISRKHYKHTKSIYMDFLLQEGPFIE